MRNLNAVGFLDPAAGRFRWVLTGPFVRQHDPDLLPDGSLLLFDNRGAVDGSGTERSQVLQIDPATQAVTWSYGGADADPPLWSEKMGNQQLLPNGNVLVTESWGGRVLEVTRDPEPVLVWAYVNGLPPAEGGGKPRVGLVSQAVRFRPEELPFLAEPPEGPVSSPGTRPAGPRAG